MRKLKIFRKNRSGISTVIATIIIVAISIVMAIAVAYWAMGIGGSFTRFEKIQYTSAYVTSTSTGWTIYMNVQNTGTAAATINNIFLNGQPFSTYPAPGVPTVVPAPNTAGVIATLLSGQSTTLNITLSNAELATSGTGFVWNSGMSVEVAIQSAAGEQLPKNNDATLEDSGIATVKLL